MSELIISEARGICSRCQSKLNPIYYCIRCGVNPFKRIKKLEAELSKVCNWKSADDGDMGYFETGCGEEFCLIEGDAKDNNYIYCPKCGGRIKEIKPSEGK